MLCAICLCSTPVFAAENTTISNNGDTATTNITYTKSSSFSVTIPLVVPLSETDTEFSILSKEMNIRPDETVYVSITDGITDEDDVILYRQNVPNGKDVATLSTYLYRYDDDHNKLDITNENNVIAKFRDSAASTTNLFGSTYATGLNILADTESGDYLGTVTFKIEKIIE